MQRTLGSSWTWQVASGAIYALFVFAVPALTGASGLAWALTVASFAVFVWLYIDFFRQWTRSTRRPAVDMVLMAVLGFASDSRQPGRHDLRRVCRGAGALFHCGHVNRSRSSSCWRPGSGRSCGSQPIQTGIVVSTWVTFVIFIVGCGNLFISDRIRQMATRASSARRSGGDGQGRRARAYRARPSRCARTHAVRHRAQVRAGVEAGRSGSGTRRSGDPRSRADLA